MRRQPVPIGTPFITLGQFLKLVRATETGGQAKLLIQQGAVRVNGEPETRRGRKLRVGDWVQLDDKTWEITECT